jgi:hypothetical protein
MRGAAANNDENVKGKQRKNDSAPVQGTTVLKEKSRHLRDESHISQLSLW